MPDDPTAPSQADAAGGTPARPAEPVPGAPASGPVPVGAPAPPSATVPTAEGVPAAVPGAAGVAREEEPVVPETVESPVPGGAAGEVVPRTVEPAVPAPAAGGAVPATPESPVLPPRAAAPRPLVHRHHWIVRLTHWVNTVVLVGMMASGLQIYNAYERFGIRGTRLPLPNPFDMHPLPRWARLGGWLAGGLSWHFFLMWPLVLNGLLYVAYLVLSGEWRPLVFRPRDVGPAIEMQKYYLHLRREHPPQGKHNALQKGAYSFIIALGSVSVLSGLALWKPVQLSWLTALFGGYELARYWHFVAVWLFAAFIVVHVVLVFVVDPASLRAMVTGWYRGRFPSHD